KGLKIDPCIPEQFKEIKVSRNFRGTTYNITIKNPNNAKKGVKELIVDGAKVEGDIIPVSDKKEVTVEAIM
ncbi:MAG: hypothetical protein J6N76_02405, partial [Lachnospiraceae bacterium]|nr:hypothetical protein [Lachnospiraceae bacterium]